MRSTWCGTVAPATRGWYRPPTTRRGPATPVPVRRARFRGPVGSPGLRQRNAARNKPVAGGACAHHGGRAGERARRRHEVRRGRDRVPVPGTGQMGAPLTAAIAHRRPGVAVRATGSRLADAPDEAGSPHEA